MTQKRSQSDASELVKRFADFINEPPQYEERRMVCDYRHELARMWIPLQEAIIRLTADGARREGFVRDTTPSIEEQEMLRAAVERIRDNAFRSQRPEQADCEMIIGGYHRWLERSALAIGQAKAALAPARTPEGKS